MSIIRYCEVSKQGLSASVFPCFSFLNDPSYKEIIENSSTFNSRLCAERRMRMPFIDTQTGKFVSIAQLLIYDCAVDSFGADEHQSV